MDGGLRITGLNVGRGGRTLVADLDAQLAPGCLLAVHGPSGCGKSSLLATLAGTLPALGGTFLWAGRRATSALLPQELGLVAASGVLANAATGRLSLRPWWRFPAGPAAADRAAAAALLARLGIAHLAWKPVRAVSGGERQRCALARTLLAPAEVLLLDEPVSQLDGARARDVLDLVRAHAREHGQAVLLALHQPELIASCDQRLELQPEGRWRWS